MNGNSQINQKPSVVQIVSVVACAFIGSLLAFSLMWCAIWKIYIDNSLLMAISTLLGGIGGALTTILVGRNLAQLNQPDEPIQTTITQPVNKPVPVEQVSHATPPPADPIKP